MLPAWRTPVGLAAALFAAVAAVGCGEESGPGDGAWEPIVAFDTGAVRIETVADTLVLTVELAEERAQWQTGLMERSSLPDDAGMLFVYPEARDTTHGFYMYRTLIPLDIAFIDGDGRIVEIVPMAPCASPNPRTCRVYRPGASYRWALEVNQGFFARHGIGEGDRVVRIDGADVGAGSSVAPAGGREPEGGR